MAEEFVDVDIADAGALLASGLDQSTPILPEPLVQPTNIQPIVIAQSKMMSPRVSAARSKT
ncbi:hypothetical protein BH93_09325 [Rhodococcoides fascians A25f]|uniref:hypothetical protein n=1 Tax=Rhodococcoides fascians TaxID=1828 RepID=UPI000AE4EF90|nr:hypothetical protein [Rhodococcus fascians]QII05547.1 hypothetical protein BH93_09325 [Rhodococcus fascians A25f]